MKDSDYSKQMRQSGSKKTLNTSDKHSFRKNWFERRKTDAAGNLEKNIN